jgi:hypothetical protein
MNANYTNDQLIALLHRRDEIGEIFDTDKFAPLHSDSGNPQLKIEHDALLDEWEALLIKIEIVELWIPEMLKQEVGSEDYFICVEALASESIKLNRIVDSNSWKIRRLKK